MEYVTVKGNTGYLRGRQLIPLYRIDAHRCILIDPGYEPEREPIAEALAREGLTPVGILLTHMHYDHHVNTGYFKRRYNIPAAMPRGEAEICRSQLSLKNHLFCFTPGLIAEYPRLQDLVCPIEVPIETEQETLSFRGAEFGIVHSPGHAPDHICIITPDKVCLMGDAILCGEDLENAGVPFCFTVAQDFATKERLKDLRCDRYLVAHCGVLTQEELVPVIDRNLLRMQERLAAILALVTKPTTLCGCYELINRQMGQAGGHPIRNQHLERYLRPYLEYLADSGQLKWVTGQGAPTLAPVDFPE